jgi:23S rRNA A2030 N6-methylase RlmJ
MPWRSLEDPDNPENRNAGNVGDLVKHTVYLTALRSLLAQPEWGQQLRLRECHAGRAIYRVAATDPRRALLDRLQNSVTPLAVAQRDCLDALGLEGDERRHWYAGSSLLTASALRQASPSAADSSHDAYEWDPRTRQLLVAAQQAAGLPAARVPRRGEDERFDGETHIADRIDDWDRRDVLLLDPFGLWIHAKHAERRARYKRIVEGMARRGDDAPCMLMFWTWGGAHDLARMDLKGDGARVQDGYQPLAAILRGAGHHPIVVSWRTELAFAMWVIVPPALRASLRDELHDACSQLLDALALDAELEVWLDGETG